MPHRFFTFFLDVLFPQECLYCHKEINRPYPLCRKCEEAVTLFSSWTVSNSSCRHLSMLGAASSYQNPILRKTIHFFKYKQIISLQLPLSRLLIKFIERNNYLSSFPKEGIYVIPIPLFPRKRKERGFNQAELLAQPVALYFHWHYSPHFLQRIRNNPPQAQLEDKEKRKGNVKGIFNLQPSAKQLKGKIVLLVDDVFTTGATMEEAAKVLKKSGVKKIIGLVLAK